MKILLFDMDGVLLESGGYHRAFQETVRVLGDLLGYQGINLTADDIAAFEAAGVFSEWDSSAMCAALLLENLWSAFPALTLPLAPDSPILPPHRRPKPDFQAFAQSLTQPHLSGLRPLQRAEFLLLDDAGSRTPAQRRTIQSVLRNARKMEGSLTHRIFQEFVLGSRVFAETYGLPPSLDTGSYLLRYDRPLLSEPTRAKLMVWLQDPAQSAVIFTSRPSRSPDGLGTPEAEIGAQGVGLEELPILGLGALTWLSARRERHPEFFLKPSPVHVLAALRLGLGDPLEGALEAVAALVVDGQADHAWRQLDDAQVCAFEDGVAGLESMRAAKDVLGQIGLSIEARLFGISDSAPKRRALEAVRATVSPTLGVALEAVPGF